MTFAADVGQEEELDGLDEKAKATGAIQHYTLDLVEEFATDFIYPMFPRQCDLRAGIIWGPHRPSTNRQSTD